MPKVTNRSARTIDIFESIQKYSNAEIPPCVKIILKSAAYDSESSLACLDSQQISDIENYMIECGENVIKNLDCCNANTYQNQGRFRLLPGHRSLILSIPATIRSMHAAKKMRSNAEFKKLQTPEELAKSLLKKMNSNMIKLHLDLGIFEDVHLGPVQINISNNKMVAKCSVACFICANESTATYSGSWLVGNIVRHVKSHNKKNTNTSLDFQRNSDETANFILSNGNTMTVENVPIQGNGEPDQYRAYEEDETFVEDLNTDSIQSIQLNKPSTSLMPNFKSDSKIKTINFGRGGSFSFNMNIQ